MPNTVAADTATANGGTIANLGSDPDGKVTNMNTNGVDEGSEGSSSLYERWRAIDFRKKCFLNLLLLANIVSDILTLRYGLGMDMNIFPGDNNASSAPTAPTGSPTLIPVTTVCMYLYSWRRRDKLANLNCMHSHFWP